MVEFSKRIGYDPVKYDRLNLVHVTGTKGKGSTCAFVQSLLHQYRTPQKLTKIGLYTSPHLRSVRERICIDGEPISEELFTKYLFEVKELLEATNDDASVTTELTKDQKPAYFKFLTLLSFYTFMKEGVDAAIYEVGIGGELDSTNIIHHPVVCGVSSIAIDHTFVLGNTVGEIAWNKSGIFKSQSSAFSLPQEPEAAQVLKERALEKGSSLCMLENVPAPLQKIKLGISGDVQYLNATLASSMVYEFLRKRDIEIVPGTANGALPARFEDLKELPEKFVRGLENAHIDGRAQTLKDDKDAKLTWYIDGSHTKESVANSSQWWRSVQEQKTNDRVKILFFNQQSRNIEELLSELFNKYSEFDYAIFTTNVTWKSHKYDINLVSMNVDEEKVDKLEMQKRSQTHWQALEQQQSGQQSNQKRTATYIYSDIESGIERVREICAKETRDMDVFVCGSLHLVGGLLVVLGR